MTEAHYDCGHPVEIEDEPRHHLVISNEYVRALAVEIAPHERTLCHRHPHDYLLYVASGSEIISAARDEEPKRLSYRDGECELSSAGLIHVVENLGEASFRNAVVELLPRVGELRRGAPPNRITKGLDAVEVFDRTTVIGLLDEDRAAIFVVAVEPGAEVEIPGPAIVATPYGNRLNPDALGDVEVRNDSVFDVAWVPPHETAILWGCWERAERAVVFQVGRTGEQGLAVPVAREPLQSLLAHADEPE